MSNFETILTAAKGLPELERQRLIDELYQTLPDVPDWSDAFEEQLERRTDELDAGTAKTVPWSEIRKENFGFPAS